MLGRHCRRQGLGSAVVVGQVRPSGVCMQATQTASKLVILMDHIFVGGKSALFQGSLGRAGGAWGEADILDQDLIWLF